MCGAVMRLLDVFAQHIVVFANLKKRHLTENDTMIYVFVDISLLYVALTCSSHDFARQLR